MCTVIAHVPEPGAGPVRLLAVRDEDPAREWNPLGAWWPETHPGVVGVRDVRAGGAWLAARTDAPRLAVLLNRADVVDVPPADLASRGVLPLAAVSDAFPTGAPRSHGFNLVDVDDETVRVVAWDGETVRTVELAPGTHMVAHDDVDDPQTARIARWRDAFAAATAQAQRGEDEDWFAPWLEVLADSGELSPEDDGAIIRDNRPHGYPTLSLLLCAATVGGRRADVRYGEFARAGRWEHVALH